MDESTEKPAKHFCFENALIHRLGSTPDGGWSVMFHLNETDCDKMAELMRARGKSLVLSLIIP